MSTLGDVEDEDDGLSASHTSSIHIAISGSHRTTASSMQTVPLRSSSSCRVDSLEAAAAVGSPTILSGPNLPPNDDSSGLPIPIGMIEAALNAAEDDIADEMGGKNVDGGSAGDNVEDGLGAPVESHVNELAGPPTPFNILDYEYDNSDEEDMKHKMNKKPAAVPNTNNNNNLEDDSIRVPTRDEIEDELECIADRFGGTSRRRGWDDIESQQRSQRRASNVSSQRGTNNIVGGNSQGGTNNDRDTNVETNAANERQVSATSDGDRTLLVPTAFLVEDRNSRDDVVYIATPIVSWREKVRMWWKKQRRATILLWVMFAIVAALAVTLGVVLSSESAPAFFIVMSSSPSVSMMPSFSPTECIDQIYGNVQQLDLKKGKMVNFPYRPKVAVDGTNMIVSVRDGSSDSSELFLILFYSLEDDGEWKSVQTPIRVENVGSSREVDISGTTAIVGYPYADQAVLVYEQNQFGEWEERDDSFKQDDEGYLGWLVDIDGDIACVRDLNDPIVNLFRRDGDKWIEFDEIVGGKSRCSIAGDSIAISKWDSELDSYVLQLYNYNQDLDEVVPTQDPIPITGIIWPWSMGLSKSYLIYWGRDDDTLEMDAFVFHRHDADHQHSHEAKQWHFLQKLNITSPQSNSIALDVDVLAVSGSNHTHIFLLQNDGNWKESIVLDKVYDDYQLSGTNLIATKFNEGEVYSYNIQHCQNTPTQAPTSSSVPTTSSFSPSTSALPTSVPSTSSSPTETCSWVEITITYDEFPFETSFQLKHSVIDNIGDNETVQIMHAASVRDTSYTKSICLEEGDYEFTIFDSDGICCNYGDGGYNITSDGALIVEGGEFEISVRTTFSIPFFPLP